MQKQLSIIFFLIAALALMACSPVFNGVLTVNASAGGTVTPSGEVTVEYGTQTSVTATPSEGYTFSGWTITSGSTVVIADSTAATTTVSIEELNGTIQANFTAIPPAQYSVTIDFEHAYYIYGNSTFNLKPSAILTATQGVALEITTATTTGSYHFVEWQIMAGAQFVAIANKDSNTTTITVSGDGVVLRPAYTC